MVSLPACLLVSIQIVTLVLAKAPPSSNPNRTLDETSDPDHGRIIDSSHAVLKLDCPGCPVYNDTWNDAATALIYDLQIVNKTSPPTIELNSGPFFPAGNNLGFTPMTRHIALPVPYTASIDDYLSSPSKYENTEMAAIITNESVPNHHGWNITRIQCINFGYGTFENRYMNISIVNLYLLTPEHAQPEIAWWEIENMAVAYSRNQTEPSMPGNLKKRLLHGSNIPMSKHAGLGLPVTLFVIGLAVCTVTALTAWMSARYQTGSRRGFYRAIASDEPLWEDEDHGGSGLSRPTFRG